MLGAVGAYAWSGTVVHQKGSNIDILPSSAFEATLQDRNHSSLLGRHLQLLRFRLDLSRDGNASINTLAALLQQTVLIKQKSLSDDT